MDTRTETFLHHSSHPFLSMILGRSKNTPVFLNVPLSMKLKEDIAPLSMVSRSCGGAAVLRTQRKPWKTLAVGGSASAQI